MILTAGTAIRFKGDNSDRMANEFADSLRGHCAIHGSKIVITKRTEIQVTMHSNGAKERAPECGAPWGFGLSLYRNGNE